MRRLDVLLVERGFFASRARAQAAIAAGLVRVGGVAAAKASALVEDDAALEADQPHPYVSRGGVKLAHALDIFSITVTDRIALDIGASTGGFTQVLLNRGARKIYAVDVGRGQLHDSLRRDSRVISLEGQDARLLTRDQIPEAPELLVCDASFIAAALVLARPLTLLSPSADAVVLVKPQFEVGRGHVGKRGVVRHPAVQEQAVEAVSRFLAAVGFPEIGRTESPIAGGDGNREWLIYARSAMPSVADAPPTVGG
jgi:23S rRNA (cytidine1920-2'-O)/16S rRNA (cytidine1409-2'-O)-methyltransferase